MEDLKTTIEKDIFKLIQEMKKCHNKRRYIELVHACNHLLEIAFLEDLDIKVPKEIDYELDKINLDCLDNIYSKQFFENLNKMFHYNEKLTKIGDYLSERYQPSSYTYNYTQKLDIAESVRLTTNFFKQYDTDIYNYFQNLKNGTHFIITNKLNDTLGTTYQSNYLIKSYVCIGLEETIIDSLTIAHETIHSYIMEKNRYIPPQESNQESINNLHEVYSMFIELLFIDYLKQIKYSPKDIRTLEIINDVELINNLYQLDINLHDDFNYQDYIKSEAYAYGSILAYHFYNNYLQNQTTTKQNIQNFMLESKSHNKSYMLNNYGLSKNKILQPQTITKYLDKHFRYN